MIKNLNDLTPGDLGSIQSCLDNATDQGDSKTIGRLADVLTRTVGLSWGDGCDTASYIVNDLKRDLDRAPETTPRITSKFNRVVDLIFRHRNEMRRMTEGDQAGYSGIEDFDNALIIETDEVTITIADSMIHAYWGDQVYGDWDSWTIQEGYQSDK